MRIVLSAFLIALTLFLLCLTFTLIMIGKGIYKSLKNMPHRTEKSTPNNNDGKGLGNAAMNKIFGFDSLGKGCKGCGDKKKEGGKNG